MLYAHALLSVWFTDWVDDMMMMEMESKWGPQNANISLSRNRAFLPIRPPCYHLIHCVDYHLITLLKSRNERTHPGSLITRYLNGPPEHQRSVCVFCVSIARLSGWVWVRQKQRARVKVKARVPFLFFCCCWVVDYLLYIPFVLMHHVNVLLAELRRVSHTHGFWRESFKSKKNVFGLRISNRLIY